MLKKKKGTIIILTSIVIICVSASMGFIGLVNSIRDERSCEWANIDNIEIHAHMDVPKVTKWDCDYEKESNTKRASFTIDQNNFDVDQYIKAYKFKRLDSFTKFEYGRFLNLKMEFLSDSDLYYKKNPSDEECYDVLLDKTTGRLWVTIKYQD